MTADTIVVRRPTAAPAGEVRAATFTLDRPIGGVQVTTPVVTRNFTQAAAPVHFDLTNHEAMAGLRALGFVGANITVPHKTAVVPLLDELRGDAQTLRAVNTIVAEGERLVGFNTDAEGVAQSLRRWVAVC